MIGCAQDRVALRRPREPRPSPQSDFPACRHDLLDLAAPANRGPSGTSWADTPAGDRRARVAVASELLASRSRPSGPGSMCRTRTCPGIAEGVDVAAISHAVDPPSSSSHGADPPDPRTGPARIRPNRKPTTDEHGPSPSGPRDPLTSSRLYPSRGPSASRRDPGRSRSRSIRRPGLVRILDQSGCRGRSFLP